MDDFLGTSIQYSERQILLLEEEHAANVQKTVEELIESGFLDSDYEDSTDSECDSIDTQNINSDIKQESNEQILQLTDKPMSRNTNDLLITIEYILHKILNDIKTLIILFVLMITLPHIIQHNTNSNNDIYFGTHYRHHIYKCEYGYSVINIFGEQNAEAMTQVFEQLAEENDDCDFSEFTNRTIINGIIASDDLKNKLIGSLNVKIENDIIINAVDMDNMESLILPNRTETQPNSKPFVPTWRKCSIEGGNDIYVIVFC